MLTFKSPKRGTDSFGSGEFGAPRGRRKHKGIDYTAAVDSSFLSKVRGTVTKLGWAYANEDYRYVEVTTQDTAKHRFFYVKPRRGLKVGTNVQAGDTLGTVQDIAGRYNDSTRTMKNHVHYEILVSGKPIDPEVYWS